MDGIRNACIVYKRKDAFETCYLKEFFKMTGFSYVDCLYGEERKDISIFSENRNFDIFINIDQAMSLDEIANLQNMIQAKFYEAAICHEAEQPEQKLLESLLENISHDMQFNRVFPVLERLAKIYHTYHLVDLFYEYTLVLHQKMEYSFAVKACERLEQALGDIEEFIGSMSDTKGKEYIVYAKYACQIMVNEYLIVQGRMERYDVGDLIDHLDEIYQYDDKYYKAEYLKALAANQSCMYNAQPRHLLSNCIRKCPVNACKSYYFYCLGKWNEKYHQLAAASSAYHVSYRVNPNNSKAAFKCAVEAKRKDEIFSAKGFLMQIVTVWEAWKDLDQIPLHDMEYAYKVRMLLASLVDSCFCEEWEKSAKCFIDAMESDTYIETMSELSFVKRLYCEKNYIQAVLDAMRYRVHLLHENNCF